MKNKSMKRLITKLLIVAVAALPLVGCVDDSYDLSKDIDLTMGLGSEGLELRLGSTERIMLADILETDENLKTQDGTNLYYLIEDGSTNMDFNINPLSFDLDNSLLEPTREIINFADLAEQFGGGNLTTIRVPAWETPSPITASAKTELNYELTDIDSSIKWVKKLTVADNTQIKFYLYIEQPDGAKFMLKEVKNLKLTFPKELKLKDATGGTLAEADGQTVLSFNTISNIGNASHEMGTVVLEGIELGDEGKIVGNSFTSKGKTISMSGDFNLSTNGGFDMKVDDKVTLHMSVYVGNPNTAQSRIDIATATGQFSPPIAPDMEIINISDNLPDFLQDETVRIKVANPTLKLSADMSNIPASLNVGVQLTSIKDGKIIADVPIPAEGDTVTAKTGVYNTIYFYQDISSGPFDITEVPESADRYLVSQLETLIEDVPDNIEVRWDGNRIYFRDEDYTIKMGNTYNTTIDYKLLVPLSFNKGLRIVYTDSVTDMHKDLKDFAAEGLDVTANIINTVPLQLKATLEPLDTEGRVLEGIKVTPATIAPASIDNGAEMSPVRITLTLNNPDDLKRVDALRFRITAESIQDEGVGQLCSDQYIEVKDMRLRLNGQVVGDFNDDDE